MRNLILLIVLIVIGIVAFPVLSVDNEASKPVIEYKVIGMGTYTVLK